jgi:Zn finger protein HypA/HybF involved in hydrogenase expression
MKIKNVSKGNCFECNEIATKIRCVHCNKEFPGSTDNLCPNCFNAGVSFALIFINQEKESKVIHEA